MCSPRDAHEYVRGAQPSQAHENMQYLAQDVGLDIGEADYALEHVLRRYLMVDVAAI